MPVLKKFKPRTYLHFDRPISESKAALLVTDPATVARHAFYPFLGYTMSTLRIKRNEDGSIEKRTKDREIKIAAHCDAAIYAHYADLLAERYEKLLAERGLESVITAFRSRPKGGTNIDHAAEVFNFINGHRPCVALAFDIQKFFDTLDHQHLKKSWVATLGGQRLPDDHFALFRSLTQFSWVSRDDAYALFGISQHNPKPKHIRRVRICEPKDFREKIRNAGYLESNPTPGKGIPQGSPISAVLSNIYMLEFDAALHAVVNEKGGLYRRYCDDILVVVPVDHADELDAFVKNEIHKIGLSINPDKIDRVEFGESLAVASDSPIQYLGFTFDGRRTLLRLSSLSRYYGKMRQGVSLAKQTQRKHNRRELAKGHELSALRTRKLFLQYSYLIGRRSRRERSDPKAHGNFLTYAYRAARKLNSPAIRHQVRAHWRKLIEAISKPINLQLRPPF